jgi:Fur family peroxide stress response transcriptional regulator
LPADWHCRHSSATGVVRGDEDDAWSSESEEVYARAKKKVPAISLATVYKNIHLFVESGVFREVSLHHGSVRVEMNREHHHHMVCLKCKGITDIGEKELGLVLTQDRLPTGFLVERYAVDAIGVCAKCQQGRFIVR